MIASWRSGPTLAHASAKSAFMSESCDPGERPQSTVTGTSWTSSAGSRSSAAVICASVSGRLGGARAERIAIEDHREHRALGGRELGADRRQRRGQAQPPFASCSSTSEARQQPVLQHIAERTLRIDVQRRTLGRHRACGRRGRAGAERRQEKVSQTRDSARSCTGRAGESLIVVSGFAARTSSSFSMRKWRT